MSTTRTANPHRKDAGFFRGAETTFGWAVIYDRSNGGDWIDASTRWVIAAYDSERANLGLLDCETRKDALNFLRDATNGSGIPYWVELPEPAPKAKDKAKPKATKQPADATSRRARISCKVQGNRVTLTIPAHHRVHAAYRTHPDWQEGKSLERVFEVREGRPHFYEVGSKREMVARKGLRLEDSWSPLKAVRLSKIKEVITREFRREDNRIYDLTYIGPEFLEDRGITPSQARAAVQEVMRKDADLEPKDARKVYLASLNGRV